MVLVYPKWPFSTMRHEEIDHPVSGRFDTSKQESTIQKSCVSMHIIKLAKRYNGTRQRQVGLDARLAVEDAHPEKPPSTNARFSAGDPLARTSSILRLTSRRTRPARMCGRCSHRALCRSRARFSVNRLLVTRHVPRCRRRRTTPRDGASAGLSSDGT